VPGIKVTTLYRLSTIGRLLTIGAACLALYSIAAFGFQGNATPGKSAAAPTTAVTPARQLVTTYCVSCHSQQLKTAGLDLERIDADHVSNAAEAWEKVIVKLRSRAMPPPGIRRPDNAAYDSAAAWLESEIDRAAGSRVNPGRSASLHRLNRAEYANAVRDLIAVEVDAQAILPPDEQAFGFENNAEALSMQPALLDRYVSAAAFISRRAVGDPNIPPAFVRYGAIKNNPNDLTYLRQTERLGEDFPLGTKGGVSARHYFPVDGEYVLRIRLQRAWEDSIRGLNVQNQIEVRVDGVRVAQFTIGGGKPPSRTFQYDADEALQARVPVKAGLRQVMATMLKSDDAEPEGAGPDRLSLYSRNSDNANSPIAIAALLIGGPYDGKVPLDSPSRRLLFVCRPGVSGDKATADEVSCATKIVSNLARRAYRRAATDEDTQTLLGFYKRARAAGNFDDGVRSALERVLVSPDFLFRIEADPAGAAPGSVYRVSDVELASRLSFALWSSIPDDTLLGQAIRDKLHEPAVLEQQVARMFADPRTRNSLVQNFFGDWLQTRNVWLLNPDSTKFPWFDDNLRTAFVTEMELFLDAQLKQDHSILDLLTSNETFLNEQLARHYGIPGVYGSHFRRVKLTDENRFGLLGKASLLAVTSYTTRTSPTIRGKYLLENLLAAPMPPPLPNVPALEASNKEGKPLAVREMLEMHRANVICASCHARMDPLGLSLENFDAIGQWRTTDAGHAIDASGVLLDGTKVNGPQALRQALVAQKTQFARAVTEKLLTYALGRGLEYYDAPAVRAIQHSAAADGYRWSSLILATVKSPAFQMRTAGQMRTVAQLRTAASQRARN
jgi:mono/diheme cytochrome c family protein